MTPVMAPNNWHRWYQVDKHETSWPGGHPTTRLTVRKRSGRDGITWDTLQAIKNDVLGTDVACIEVFPAVDDLVYEINARHLWAVPDGVRVPSLKR